MNIMQITGADTLGSVIEQVFDFHPILGGVLSSLFVISLLSKVFLKHLRKVRAPKSTREEIDDYLKNPAYPGGPLEMHLQDTRAYWVFKKLSGIRCKKPMREALIALHDGEKIPSSWSWGYLSDASRHLEFEDGILKYRVNSAERLFQLVHYGLVTTLGCMALMSAVAIVITDKPSQAWPWFVVMAVVMFFAFWFFGQALPLERARTLKYKTGMSYYSGSSPLDPLRLIRWIAQKIFGALRCKRPEATTRRRGTR